MSVEFPAGALDKVTRITIRPLATTAPNAVGPEYAFEPAGLTLAKPVQVRMSLDSAGLGNEVAEGIGIAEKDSTGTWQANMATEFEPPPDLGEGAQAAARADAAVAGYSAGVMSLPTMTLVTFWKVEPRRATVDPLETVNIRIVACLELEEAETRTPLRRECAPSVRTWHWTVNGFTPGNDFVGRVTPLTPSSSARYRAPFLPATKLPIEFWATTPGSSRVMPTRITVTPHDTWAGTINYSYSGDTTYVIGDRTTRESRSGGGTINLKARPGKTSAAGGFIQAASWTADARYEFNEVQRITGAQCPTTITTTLSRSGGAAGVPDALDPTGSVTLLVLNGEAQIGLQTLPVVDATGPTTTVTTVRCSGESEDTRTSTVTQTESERLDHGLVVNVPLDLDEPDVVVQVTKTVEDQAHRWVKIKLVFDIRRP